MDFIVPLLEDLGMDFVKRRKLTVSWKSRSSRSAVLKEIIIIANHNIQKSLIARLFCYPFLVERHTIFVILVNYKCHDGVVHVKKNFIQN